MLLVQLKVFAKEKTFVPLKTRFLLLETELSMITSRRKCINANLRQRIVFDNAICHRGFTISSRVLERRSIFVDIRFVLIPAWINNRVAEGLTVI